MRALVLDFDGVVIDSAREGLLVSLRTYLDLDPGSPLATEAPELEAVLLDPRTGLHAHPRLAAFMALMPLGNRAEDYGVAWAILEHGARVEGQADYDAFYAGTDPGWRQAFHARFYERRHAWVARRRDEWLALHRPYDHVAEVLGRHLGEVAFGLATAKDRASVWALLEAFGLAALFCADLVADKETGVSKIAHLHAIRDRLACRFEELTFVDDKLNHLEAVAALGVRGVLAAWGYNGERERALARARGFAMASAEDLEAALFSS
ncbi:MAG TPA: HAD hydrolase-like protein [Thermoanaerobaculaceae bacterium]|nr:HAD hydrolase-like protein [Thermoanaerobaculaceae bacterium]HRS14867.1 HAD hydrolase-like protein [Thermoanaerobaculaceae bacterium]